MAAAAQEALLALQDADTAMDQLRRRRDHAPERAAATAAEAAAVGAKQAHDVLAKQVAGLAERQAALEAQLADAEKKADAVDHRLRSGESTAARDVVRWGEELDHLRERSQALEDEAFAILSEREDLEAELAGLAEQLAAAVDAVRAARGALAGVEASVDGELAAAQRRRDELVASVPADLVALYERIRAKLGGVGAARLVDGSCTGCHLALSPRDLDDAKRMPEDAVLTCDSCGRILVR